MSLEIPIISGFKPAQPNGQPTTEGRQARPSSPLAQVVVLARLEGDLILLKVGQQEAVARNTVGLKPGQVVRAEVLSGRSGQADLALRLLSPLPEEGGPAGRLFSGLSEAGPPGPALTKLWGLLNEPGPRGPAGAEEAVLAVRQGLAKALMTPGRISAADLKEAWSSLGLDYEPKLARAVRGKGGQERPADLAQVLKPRLMALVRTLDRWSEPVREPLPAEPGSQAKATLRSELKRAMGELEKALARLREGLKPEPGQGQDRGSVSTRPGESPSLPTSRPDQILQERPPEARPAALPRTRLPSPTRPDGETRLEPERPPFRPAVIPDRQLRELARIKGRFLRAVLRRPDRPPEQGQKEAAPLIQGRARAEVVREVVSAWPRLAEALSLAQSDLKSLVAVLEKRLSVILGSTASPERLLAMVRGAEEALRGLEGVQVANSLAAETETSYLLPLNFLPGGGLVSGQMLYYRPPFKGSGQEGKQPLRMVFLLDLSRLGEVRVDVSLADKEVRLNLYLTKPEAEKWAAGRLDELKKALDGLGYQVRQIGLRSLVQAPPVEELAPRPRPGEGAGMIDLRA